MFYVVIIITCMTLKLSVRGRKNKLSTLLECFRFFLNIWMFPLDKAKNMRLLQLLQFGIYSDDLLSHFGNYFAVLMIHFPV